MQFEQEIPEGFHRLGHWPVELFNSTLPPPPPKSQRPVLREESLIRKDLCEIAPFVMDDKLCLMECVRPSSGGDLDQYPAVTDVEGVSKITWIFPKEFPGLDEAAARLEAERCLQCGLICYRKTA